MGVHKQPLPVMLSAAKHLPRLRLFAAIRVTRVDSHEIAPQPNEAVEVVRTLLPSPLGPRLSPLSTPTCYALLSRREPFGEGGTTKRTRGTAFLTSRTRLVPLRTQK